MKRGLVIVVLVALSATVYGYYRFNTTEFVPEIRTVDVVEGDIVDTVGATGALEAVTTVNVGSQVSGIIQDLLVDYNSIVRRSEVIMRLDPSLFETQIEQARANLVRAEADVEGLQVGLEDAQMQLSRIADLAERELVSQIEFEAAQLAVRSAAAQLKSSEAAVIQAQASLNQTEVNLEHTVIRAPIDGIVISRLVDIGQTVAASLQAPELFVIAADLTKMRVIANIDESDVGRIRPEQRVTFTVDAFPEEEFEGHVSQIRLEPVVTQNVVTYATVIDAPNPDLRLKPGMTATVTLEIARRENVMRIPNQALRFQPTAQMFAAIDQPVPSSRQVRGPGGEAGAGSDGRSPGSGEGFGGGDGGFGDGGGGAPDPERRKQMRERMAQMSPEEREAFLRNDGRLEALGAPHVEKAVDVHQTFPIRQVSRPWSAGRRQSTRFLARCPSVSRGGRSGFSTGTNCKRCGSDSESRTERRQSSLGSDACRGTTGLTVWRAAPNSSPTSPPRKAAPVRGPVPAVGRHLFRNSGGGGASVPSQGFHACRSLTSRT